MNRKHTPGAYAVKGKPVPLVTAPGGSSSVATDVMGLDSSRPDADTRVMMRFDTCDESERAFAVEFADAGLQAECPERQST